MKHRFCATVALLALNAMGGWADAADIRLGQADAYGVVATIRPDPNELGSKTNLFIAVSASNVLFLRGADLGDWQPYSGANIRAAAEGVTLVDGMGVMVTNYDLSALAGAQVYVGYGQTGADLGRPGHVALVYQQGRTPLQPSCSLASADWGADVRQDGDMLIVSTQGRCLAPPPGHADCAAVAATAPTGVSQLLSSQVTRFDVQGVSASGPTAVDAPLRAHLRSLFALNQCTMNAPAASPAKLAQHYDVCYDETGEAQRFLDGSLAKPFVTLDPPVEVAVEMDLSAKVVPDCFQTGADRISDALTGERWVRQADGRYLSTR